jgi:hypothetical protein
MPTPKAVTLSRRGPVVGLIVFALVVVGLGYVVLRVHRHHHAYTYDAKSAVSVLLKAGETDNLTLAKDTMCAADLSHSSQLLSQLVSSGRVESYRVDVAATRDASGDVVATVKTAGHGTTALIVPVVEVAGGWHACVSNAPAPLTFAGPTTGQGIACATPADLPAVAASQYVFAAAAGRDSLAQSCVFGNAVRASVTASLDGVPLTARAVQLRGTGPFTYTAAGRAVTVTVTQEHGRNYVTAVRVA